MSLLQTAVDAIGLVIVVVDADGRVLVCNRAFEKAVGTSPAPRTRQIWDFAAESEEKALLRGAFNPFDEETFPEGFLLHLAGEGGSTRVLDCSSRVVSPPGKPPTVVFSGVDLSERLRAEKRLGEPDVVRQLLLNTIPAVIWSVDADLRFTSSAGGGLEGLSLEPGQVALLSTSLFSYFHTNDPAHPVIAAHIEALRGKKSALDIPWLEHTFQARIEPLIDESGTIIGALGMALDITDRVEAERALRESEARLRRLVESNVIGILFWSSDGKVLQANQALLDLLGYTEEDVRTGAMSWQDMTPPEYRQLDEHALVEIEATGSCTPFEKEYVHKDGHRVPVLIGGASLAGRAPRRPYDGVAFVVDLSEQVRLRSLRDDLLVRERGARREVELANARLRLLARASERLAQCLRIDDTMDALAELAVPAVADWSYVIHLGWDGAGPRLVATAHSDPAKASLLGELRSFVPDFDAPEGSPLVIRTGEPALYEDITEEQLTPRPPQWPIVGTRDPAPLHLIRELGMRSLLCVPIRGRVAVEAVMMLVSSTDPHRYTRDDLVLARDLANRAAVSLENGRLLAEARDAVTARDEFLSIAAHELRTPMTSLLLRTETLRRALERGDLGREAALRSVAAADAQARRLSSLTDDLLDVSRLAVNRMTMRMEEVDLAQVVRDVVATMASELRRAGCAVNVAAPDAVRGRWDRTRMEQVLTNLMSNAMKFGAGKPIDVAVAENPRQILTSVRDYGIGISREDQSRIFGRFERAVSTRHYGGLGLGLYISVQILRAHGGSLRVDSEPGQGACFTVVLPR